ncbi:hypothetical protein NF865_09290 [Thermococcus aggregans]|uniref:Uncharacterized protein n=1 Tax=Thermococcus aggregans TaxID=110163 RepID=A0A9E7SNL5_THEAG|nr:hypothetical protein [Thermococcus aggregans]USS40481.1 hypothetical protein NF865_09290 [Thermococcus aggregans]
MVRKKRMSVSGVKFDEEKTETFEIPSGLVRSLKGYLGEKIAGAYLWDKIIPELKKQYDYVSLFFSNLAPVRLTSIGGKPPTNLEIASGFFREVFGLDYGTTWVPPTAFKTLYVLKEQRRDSDRFMIRLKLERDNALNERVFIIRVGNCKIPSKR